MRCCSSIAVMTRHRGRHKHPRAGHEQAGAVRVLTLGNCAKRLLQDDYHLLNPPPVERLEKVVGQTVLAALDDIILSLSSIG